MFLNPNIFFNLNCNCSTLLDMRNLQEHVKKAFCCQELFWTFTVWINCSSDLKCFANSHHSASNFKRFSQSLEQFFLAVGQNNFGNKIPILFLLLLQFNEFSFANFTSMIRLNLSHFRPLCFRWRWRWGRTKLRSLYAIFLVQSSAFRTFERKTQ